MSGSNGLLTTPTGESASSEKPAAGATALRDLNDERQQALLDEAWRQLYELLHEGKITLPNGLIVDKDDKNFPHYIAAVTKLCHFKPPKTKRVPLIEDFTAPETTAKP